MMLAMINPGAIIISALAPAITGVILALEVQGRLSFLMTLIVVAIPVLFNASVNLLNDYYDFIRGNDTKDNITDEIDAPLAYHNVDNPKPVLILGFGCLLAGIILGIYVILQSGYIPLIIGSIGVLTVLAYSAGKLPLSHLPVGELVAGFVMGGLIPLGVYSAFTGEADLAVLYKSIPNMIIVSQLMLLNNTCDIERDIEAGRKTLPIILGREKAKRLCTILTVLWILQILHVVFVWYPIGSPLMIIMLLLCRKSFLAICRGERSGNSKNTDALALAGAALAVAVCYPLTLLIHILFG